MLGELLQMILVVGTKLQHIIQQLALETAQSQGVIGENYVKARDSLFWFNRPQILLYLIHFILFQVHCQLSNEMKLSLKSPKRLMGLRVHQDGFKAVNSLEWQSEVASVRIVFDVHFMLEFWVNNRLIMICVSL